MSSPSHAAPTVGHRPPAVVRWVGWLCEASGWMSAIALVAATLITTHAVITRYFFRQPTVWQTESTIYLLMLVTFIGAAYGLKHHAHVGVDLLINAAPQRPQLIGRMVNAFLCLGVVLVVMATSFLNWQEAYLYDFRSATAFRFPLWISYAILPLGMLFVALQLIAMIIEGVLGLTGRIPIAQVSMMEGTSELAQVQADLELEAAVHEDAAHGDGAQGDGAAPPTGDGSIRPSGDGSIRPSGPDEEET